MLPAQHCAVMSARDSRRVFTPAGGLFLFLLIICHGHHGDVILFIFMIGIAIIAVLISTGGPGAALAC